MTSSHSKSTVDNTELKFYDTDSYSTWEENSTLLKYNAVRVPFIKDGLLSLDVYDDAKDEEALRGLKILDVGCGVGYLSEALAKLGAEVTGIDVSAKRIETAKNHAAGNSKTKNIRYIVSSIEDHSRDHKNFYDAIIASEILEHVANPELFVESCVAALQRGGSILFTTPGKTIFSRLYVIFLAEYVFGGIPRGTHTYDKLISPIELQRILRRNNCRTVETRGIFFNLLTRSWSFFPYEGLFYGLHAVKNF